jgi:hypothetical protein
MMKLGSLLFFSVFALSFCASLHAQTNSGDYAITYGVNYSSGDRKDTVFPSWVGPASFVYRPWCPIAVGVDDDTFVLNNSAKGRVSGTGDLGFEGHVTLWSGHGQTMGNGECAGKKNPAITFDYIATVPVSGTLESKELVNQFKATYNRPLASGNFFVNVGLVSTGLSSGGTTQNALLSGNYLRNLDETGTWAVEGEVDLQSASKLAPSSAALLFAGDASLGKHQQWGVRFGASLGLTPYAPKVSPFIQVSYNGNLKPKRKQLPQSVLRE